MRRIVIGSTLAIASLIASGSLQAQSQNNNQIESQAQSGGSIEATLVIDPNAASLKDSYMQPEASPIEIVELKKQGLNITAFVKKAPKRGKTLQVELFFESLEAYPQKDLIVSLNALKGQGIFSKKGVFNFTHNPFNEKAWEVGKGINLGDLTSRGIARMVLGVPYGFGKIQLEISASTTPTKGNPVASSTMALANGDREIWSVFADGNLISLANTETQNVIKTWEMEGQPSGLTLSPDGKFAIVAMAKSNQLAVISRETLQITQTLNESNGLGRELRHIIASPDGRYIAVAGYVSDTVDILEWKADQLEFVKSIKVGRRPTGMAIDRYSKNIFVGHYLPRGPIIENESWLSIIDLDKLELASETRMPDQFNKSNAECIKKPFKNPLFELRFGETTDDDIALESVVSQISGVFLNPNGSTAMVPGTRVSGGVQIWETGPNASTEVSSLVTFRPGELSIPIMFFMHTDGKNHLEPQILDGYERPTVAKEYSRCLNLEREFDFTSYDIRETAPNEYANRFATFATGISGISEIGAIRQIAYTKGGRRALLLSYTSDEIAVQDALTGHPTSIHHFMLSGKNPSGIIVSQDGTKAFVSYANEPSVSVLDISSYAEEKALPKPSYVPYEFKYVEDIPYVVGVLGGRKEEWLVRNVKDIPDTPPIVEVGKIKLGEDKMDPEIRRGKVLFSSSNPEKYPVSNSRLGSCESCHPDGGTDGSAWATVEGERRTLSLRGGVAGRGWLHISATHKDIHEFVDIVVTERLGGYLNKADQDALSKYVAFHIPRLQPPKTDPVLVAKGKQLFEANCLSCHPTQGSGNPSPENDWGGADGDPLLFDIGTGTDNSFVVLGTIFERLFPEAPAKLLGTVRGDRALGEGDYAQEILDFRQRPNRAFGEFKTPSFINVWDNPVFFHSAHIASLEEAVEDIYKRLGLTVNADETKALVEYMKTM